MKYTHLTESDAAEIIATYRRAVNSCLSAGLTAELAHNRAIVAVDLDNEFLTEVFDTVSRTTVFHFLNNLVDKMFASHDTHDNIVAGEVSIRWFNMGDHTRILFKFQANPPQSLPKHFKTFVDTRFGQRAENLTMNFDPFSGDGLFAYFDIQDVIGKEFEGDFDLALAA